MQHSFIVYCLIVEEGVVLESRPLENYSMDARMDKNRYEDTSLPRTDKIYEPPWTTS